MGTGGQKCSSEGTHEILSVAQRTKSVLGIDVLINSSYILRAPKKREQTLDSYNSVLKQLCIKANKAIVYSMHLKTFCSLSYGNCLWVCGVLFCLFVH